MSAFGNRPSLRDGRYQLWNRRRELRRDVGLPNGPDYEQLAREVTELN